MFYVEELGVLGETSKLGYIHNLEIDIMGDFQTWL